MPKLEANCVISSMMELEDLALTEIARDAENEAESYFFEVFGSKGVHSKDKGVSSKANQKTS